MSSAASKERIRSWAYISKVIEGPHRSVQNFLAQGMDVEELARGIRHQESWLGELRPATAARYQWTGEDTDLENINRLGGRLLTPDDSDWPNSAFAQSFGFAATGCSEHIRTYQSDAVAPHALWVRGNGNLEQLSAQAVGVVGTRAVTQYGAQATKILVSGLARHQWTVISGGALGTDAIAHREALAAGGTTIAIAACGLDRNYPVANRQLFDSIAKNGLIISEYPPGSTPHRHRFLTRNRLVAALSQGVVVVEAAWRSGALNTLSWASGLGRVAMAVPGPIIGPNSLGCHQRIRTGQAEMVCSSDEIRALLSSVGEIDTEKQYELNFAADIIQTLPRNELRVFDSLGASATSTQMVASGAGLALALTMHLLLILEEKGLCIREKNNWRRS